MGQSVTSRGRDASPPRWRSLRNRASLLMVHLVPPLPRCTRISDIDITRGGWNMTTSSRGDDHPAAIATDAGEFEIRELLFATDFSDASAPAGRVAMRMARRHGARLHVLHVVPPVTDPVLSRRALGDLARTLGSDVSRLRSGAPARQIVAYAGENAIDLIVVGAHGRTGLSRVLLGSVAEAVVRRAPCPVLVVPAARVPVHLAAAEPDADEAHRHCCIVCATPDPALICAPCRARIRGEALERKLADERAGRR